VTAGALHLNLDEAWDADELSVPTIGAREWAPHLRFSSPAATIERFFAEHAERLGAFTLYGSGDFHHLSGLLVRRFTERLVVVSFDNHPDWDIRPPKWCCGSWVNRALELPHVEKVAVWGCGNFECWWPTQAFGNRRAERAGTLEVHAWADGQSPARQKRRGVIFRDTWRARFEQFVATLNAGNVYVTIDLDCLRGDDAVTNWESGKFTLDDLVWALGALGRGGGRVIGGDICGAYSPPVYARWKQRLLGNMDHPKLPPPNQRQAREINLRAFRALWPALTDGDDHDSGGD
jgi:arginase family enzyme